MSDKAWPAEMDFGDWSMMDWMNPYYSLSMTGGDRAAARCVTHDPFMPGATVNHNLIGCGIDDEDFEYRNDSLQAHDLSHNSICGQGSAEPLHSTNDRPDLWDSIPSNDASHPMSTTVTDQPGRPSESRSHLLPHVLSKSPHVCHECESSFPSRKQRNQHSDNVGHSAFKCYECGSGFKTSWDLDYHAGKTGHGTYRCHFPGCDATFSRKDVMYRHRLVHEKENVKYSCKLCKKWKAPSGFVRKDHLKQHLRNYHHIEETEESAPWRSYGDVPLHCPHQACPLFRDTKDHMNTATIRKVQIFKSRSDYTAHLRKEHDESPFPCTVRGCKRIGRKGYFRKRDLLKHVAKEHSDSESQATTPGDGLDMEVDGYAEEV